MPLNEQNVIHLFDFKECVEVVQWGNNFDSFNILFHGNTKNLSLPSSIPNNITDMSFMFTNATIFDKDISNWDVSNGTNMSYMFAGAEKFNQNLSTWCINNQPVDFADSSKVTFPNWGNCA